MKNYYLDKERHIMRSRLIRSLSRLPDPRTRHLKWLAKNGFPKYLVRHFAINHSLLMDNPELQRLSKNLRIIKRKHDDLTETRDDLKLDKDTANIHRLALVKRENDQIVDQQEQNAIADIKGSYPSFFESDDEESDPEIETSNEYKERKKVNNVIEYLNGEIKSSERMMERLVEEWNNVHANINKILSSTQSIAGSSSDPTAGPSDPVASSSASVSGSVISTEQVESVTDSSSSANKKRKLPLEDEMPDKRINTEKDKSTSDYIDNLPSEYNPFDDLGGD